MHDILVELLPQITTGVFTLAGVCIGTLYQSHRASVERKQLTLQQMYANFFASAMEYPTRPSPEALHNFMVNSEMLTLFCSQKSEILVKAMRQLALRESIDQEAYGKLLHALHESAKKELDKRSGRNRCHKRNR